MQLDVTIIEKGVPGGQMLSTDEVENVIGFGLISGIKLSQKMHDQLTEYENIRFKTATVKNITNESNEFIITLSDNSQLIFDSVIIATGSSPRKLGVIGEEEGAGRTLDLGGHDHLGHRPGGGGGLPFADVFCGRHGCQPRKIVRPQTGLPRGGY
jgi:thioredoxin reductase